MLLAVLAAAVSVPSAWEPVDRAGYARSSAWVAVVLSALVVGLHRERDQASNYAHALTRAVALEVHLGHVRAASVHLRDGRVFVTVIWREQRTMLLDADCHVLAARPRNVLVDGWTMSFELDDLPLAQTVASDTSGGTIVLHASVDLVGDPWATLGNGEVHIDTCVLDFSTYCGVIQRPHVLARGV